MHLFYVNELNNINTIIFDHLMMLDKELHLSRVIYIRMYYKFVKSYHIQSNMN